MTIKNIENVTEIAREYAKAIDKSTTYMLQSTNDSLILHLAL